MRVARERKVFWKYAGNLFECYRACQQQLRVSSLRKITEFLHGIVCLPQPLDKSYCLDILKDLGLTVLSSRPGHRSGRVGSLGSSKLRHSSCLRCDINLFTTIRRDIELQRWRIS
jgi:hypothetical protein